MMAVLLALVLLQEESVAVPGSKIPVKLVKIPAGKLGEVPVAAFRMGKHEVTWGQYFEFQKRTWEEAKKAEVDGITRPTDGQTVLGFIGEGRFFQDDRPVIALRIHTAIAYCDWLSLRTGGRFRLPTEAEWEFACREEDEGWHAGNAKEPKAVGARKPNAHGLHDMLGNAWEYCLDSMSSPEYSPVLRGGAWNTNPGDVTTRARRGITADWYEADPQMPKSVWWLYAGTFAQGFRVACVEDGVDSEVRQAYRRNVEIRVTGSEELALRARPALGSPMVRVRGEVVNKGDRTISEMDVTAYYLTPDGKPHQSDVDGGDKPGRATFGRCHPVMVPLGKGEEARPLKPGETRAWTVEIPMSFDPDDEVNKKAFGARVETLLFAPTK